MVTVTPRTYPGTGIYWQGFVSAPDTVTVKVSAPIATFVTRSIYDVQVNDGGTPAGVVTSVTGTLPIVITGTAAGPNVTINPATAAASGAVKPDNFSIAVGTAGNVGEVSAAGPYISSAVVASATASGVVSFLAINGLGLSTATSGNIAVTRAYIFPKAFTVTRVVIQSDTGPTGIGNAATLTVTMVKAAFAPGTPVTAGSFSVLDSLLVATVTGPTALNADINTFTANPLVIPANTLAAIQISSGGGTPSTAQVYMWIQIYGHWSS